MVLLHDNKTKVIIIRLNTHTHTKFNTNHFTKTKTKMLQQQQQQQLSSNNKFKQACCHSLASSFKILQFPSTKHIITGCQPGRAKKFATTATTNIKIEQKKPLTHHTQNHTKNKISTKSAQNEQNYFVKERKSAAASKLYEQ